MDYYLSIWRILLHYVFVHIDHFFPHHSWWSGSKTRDLVALQAPWKALTNHEISSHDNEHKTLVPYSTDTPGRFTLFSKLPIELRLQILELSLPERRGREVGAPPSSLVSGRHPRYDPLPSLLWVNNESRQLALHLHKYTFRDESLKELFPQGTHHFEYIVNYQLDTFVFRNILRFLQYHSALQFHGSGHSFPPLKRELEKIVRLKIDALDPTPDWFASQIEEYLRHCLPVFTSLQSICFALHLQVGDSSWAELNLETARVIGSQYLEEYQCQQQEAGIPWRLPMLRLEIVEVP